MSGGPRCKVCGHWLESHDEGRFRECVAAVLLGASDMCGPEPSSRELAERGFRAFLLASALDPSSLAVAVALMRSTAHTFKEATGGRDGAPGRMLQELASILESYLTYRAG